MSDPQSDSAVAYLKANVSDALRDAFCELVKSQPADGIDFLSTYLRQYSSAQQLKRQRELEERERDELKQELAADYSKNFETVFNAKKSERDSQEKNFVEMLEKLKNEESPMEEWNDDTWESVVKCCGDILGATSSYLGPVELNGTSGENEIIFRFGDKEVVHNVVKASEGVSHKVFEEVPRPETLDEEAPWRSFQHVIVPRVTENTAVKYFNYTKLGQYACFPIFVQSYLTDEAFSYFLDFERQAMEPKLELAEGEEPPEEPVPEPPAVELRYVFSCDTLGDNSKNLKCIPIGNGNNSGSTQEVADSTATRIHEFLDAVGSCKSKTEFKDVQTQAKLFLIQHEEQEAFMALASQAPEVSGADRLAAWKEANIERLGGEGYPSLTQPIADAATGLNEASAAYEVACTALEAHSGAMVECLRQCVVSKPELTACVSCALHLSGFTNKELATPPYNTLEWSKVKRFIPQFPAKAKACVLDKPRTGLTSEQKLFNIQAAKPETPATLEEASSVGSFGLTVLLNWLNAAMAFRQSYLDTEQAFYDRDNEVYQQSVAVLKEWVEQEQQEHAEGEVRPDKPSLAPKPTPLDEIDDDFKKTNTTR